MQSPDQSTTVEEVVLINPDPVLQGVDLADDVPTNGAAGITLGLLLIFLSIIIGTANLAVERRRRSPRT